MTCRRLAAVVLDAATVVLVAQVFYELGYTAGLIDGTVRSSQSWARAMRERSAWHG